jgi:4-amino-4-deoxy-L-arabinose transferase-like glycosyltransferase
MNTTSKHQDSKRLYSLWLPLLLLGVISLLLFFVNLGGYPLLDMDEPRYAEAAREMLERGSWITPTFNYELRFDKPVFFYWLIATAYQWFGVSEFSARLFSAITATLTVLSLFLFGRYWVSPRFGIYAAIILATSLEFVGLARMSVTDMTLSCFITLTILTLFMVVHHSPKWWLLGGFFAALAILTKGPVGLVIPGAILILYTWMTGQLKRCLFTPWFAIALGISLALSIPWYILAYLENGDIFIDALLHHNVTRFSDVVSGHNQPFYFFFVVLLVGFLPWSVFLPTSLYYWFKEFKTVFKGDFRAHYISQSPLVWVALYAFIWILYVFIFFTVAQTKLLTYILPLFPALALLMAATWHQLMASKDSIQKLYPSFKIASLVLVGIFLVGGIIFAVKPALFLPREAKTLAENPENMIAVLVLTLGSALMVWAMFKKSFQTAFVAQSVGMVGLTVVAVYGIIPQVSHETQGAVMSYLQQAGDAPLITYEMTRPSLTYYGQRKIIRVPQNDKQALLGLFEKNPTLFVITKNSFIETLKTSQPNRSTLTLLEKGKRYSFFKLNHTSPSEPIQMNFVEDEPSGSGHLHKLGKSLNE